MVNSTSTRTLETGRLSVFFTVIRGCGSAASVAPDSFSITAPWGGTTAVYEPANVPRFVRAQRSRTAAFPVSPRSAHEAVILCVTLVLFKSTTARVPAVESLRDHTCRPWPSSRTG